MKPEANGLGHEEQERLEWQSALQANVRIVGNELGEWGDLLSKTVRLRLVSGDERFSPLPYLKTIDGDIEVTCNIDAFDLWQNVLSEVANLPEHEIRDIYLATAAARVHVAYLSFAARQEQRMDERGTVRAKAREQVQEIVSKLYFKEELLQSAARLELNHDIVGAVSSVEKLTDANMAEINWIRYGLGTAFFALNLSDDKKEDIVNAFRSNLKSELDRHEETLLTFLDAFSNEESFSHLTNNAQAIRRYAFPHFLFAGTIPMGYSEK